MTPGTLKDGEFHPSAVMALEWIRSLPMEKLAMWQESFSSTAIEGNRVGQICSETLHRIMTGGAISDRYLLGLAWCMRHEGDFEDKLQEAVGILVDREPSEDSLEGQLLSDLADAIEKYEKVKYPFRNPSEEELKQFREEESKVK